MAVPRRSTPGSSSLSSGYADVSEMEKYKMLCNIGKGSFGVISKVQRVDDGKEFALKELDYSKMTEKDRKQILAEVAILDSLKHRNIVQLIQKIKDPKKERIFIVMEYCTSGDLGSLIRKSQRTSQPIHEDKIWNIFLQIALALHHCHWPAERPGPGQKGGAGRLSGGVSPTEPGGVPRYQVLHRDLKPENVFLSDDFVKLGDFGLSKDMGTAAFTSTYVGTPLYMPPEILAENQYDTKSDIWSLGCLVFEMCALVSPFSTAQTQAELITMVKSGKLPILPAHISPGLKGVIKAMLNLNPVKRPSTKDLLEMDEMKLHRKLFTVQNQTSLLLSRKEELRQLEQHVLARVSNLDEREKAISGTETTLAAREAACSTREEENRETQRKLNLAAEALRGYWDKLRGEKEREKETVGLGLPGLPEERAPPRRSSAVPVRPPLEERNTVPLAAVPRCPRNPHPAYEDTPSKIPLAATIASPVRLDRFANFPARSATPLRRNATKSLGNLAAAARADAEREATWSGAIEATPARQAIPFSRHQRTSIGSPSELKAGWCEDISMASPAMSIASPGPISHRPRRSSVAPSAFTSHQSQNSTNPALTSVSSSESIESQRSATSMGSDVSGSKTAMILPTMIPVPTFVYREAATPARWAPEDPDLPSPFIRRYATASPIPTSNTERQPLGAINVQPTMQPPQHLGKGPTKCAPMPRSKSGNLHQHVLRVNAQQALAGRTSGEGVRARAAALSKEAAKVMGA